MASSCGLALDAPASPIRGRTLPVTALVALARRDLGCEQLLAVAEGGDDHPLVVADAPSVRCPHQAGGLHAEALVELPVPRADAVVHRPGPGVDLGRIAVDHGRHAGDVVERDDLVASDHWLRC